ncbi:Panacea domain-containing protein [Halostella litorea]|uniref:hypothetical protein n=1 Tax=Halostella litorea TaxID=2528831 RepID=UPI0010927D0B|nr:hypothetical protein [Halostella litorea]
MSTKVGCANEMSSGSDGPGSRDKWILCLLYAPNQNGESCPIYGTTRLMKACFLIDQKMDEAFGTETGFEFHADKYGPLDPGVYDAVDRLEDRGLIDVDENGDHDGDYDGTRYAITAEGTNKAKEYFTRLSENQIRLVKWVKYDKAMVPLGQLLASVYSQYPDYTTKSVLK